jgi:hypothetical protein
MKVREEVSDRGAIVVRCQISSYCVLCGCIVCRNQGSDENDGLYMSLVASPSSLAQACNMDHH